jgi:DNA mismatch repair protein MutS
MTESLTAGAQPALAERAARKGGAAATPLMRQYLRLKQEHADAFLFFRLGDFYEMFLEDAIQGAQILGLTLTSRNKSDPDPIPMCGIPWHQRDAYVARLLRLGHKVAICEQLEAPTAAKPLVDRGVTEILTPGSVTADAFLDPGTNNYLVAVWPDAERAGVCVADASTGEVRVAEPAWADVASMLSRLRVAEWLLPSTTPETDERFRAMFSGLPGARTTLPAKRFLEAPDPRSRWRAEGVAGIEGMNLGLRAASAAVDYLDRMHGGLARQLDRVERWSEDESLRYDAATARHLELFQPQPGGEPAHTLWHHLNRSVTALGSRRLRDWVERPLARAQAVRERHDAVQAWIEASEARASLRLALRSIPDLERLAARLAGARATPRDLGAIRDALALLPAVHALLKPLQDPVAVDARARIAGIPELETRLRKALVDEPPPVSRDGGIFRAGHDATRDQLDDLTHSGKRWIAELETTERARTGIASLKVGFNRVFGYYLEVTRPHLDKVPATWERRQTLTSAERFITPELKVKEGEVLGAEEKLKSREHELFVELRESAAVHVPALQAAAGALGTLDALATLAETAVQYAWVRPEINDGDRLQLEGSRHPVVERLLPRGEFVPNDCDLDAARRQILLLTGPNMGGKSTYLRQVALAVILAQSGAFVPASRAEIGLVDRVFTRVGAGDRLGSGQSTFMVEMSETADIMRSATPRSLVVLDEVGRGTATYDGLAIAWAVTEFLHDAGGPQPRTLFATHYHELTQLAERLPRLVNVHMLVQELHEQVVFLHRIADGAADRSYGIHVAQLAGLPRPVIERAREVLAELESERTVEHLESNAPRDARREAAGQLGLFEAPAHPLTQELAAIDPDAMTPLAALERLSEWKRRWGG